MKKIFNIFISFLLISLVSVSVYAFDQNLDGGGGALGDGTDEIQNKPNIRSEIYDNKIRARQNKL